jgi:predicted enzyme related to lactoylglutathione lyase
MPVRVINILIQVENVDAMTHFWGAQIEGWRPEPAGDGAVRFVPSEEDGSKLGLVLAPGASAKTGKNRLHLDLNTWDYVGDRETLPSAGARMLDIGQGELVPWTVFADPEGNEFCLLKPRDRYDNSGAIAAIVVDCADPEALAGFWSAAIGWGVVESEAGFASLRVPGGVGIPARGPFLEFCRVEQPSRDFGRMSLGLESFWAHQHEADVAALVARGARVLRQTTRESGEVSCSIMADPEGNEFRVTLPVWPPPAPEPRRRSVHGPALRS